MKSTNKKLILAFGLLISTTSVFAQFSTTAPGGNVPQYNNGFVGLNLSGGIPATATQALDVGGNIAIRGTHLVFRSANSVIDWGGGSGDLIFRALGTLGDVNSFNNVMTLKYNGFLILGGHHSPTQRLQVDNGNILVRGTNNFTTAGHEATLFLGDANNYIKTIHGSGIRIGCYGGANAISIANNTGNVGIGTTNPGTYKLAVEGALGARSIKVTNAAWADYVFEKDYNMMSLKEVEAFILKNKHLPEIPSANEITENGLELGEMMKLQMQKIEELTLYVIQQQKEIELLKASKK